MSTPAEILTIVTALGCGLAAGVFFAFSSFVMQGLHDAGARSAIAAMQGINRLALTPVFMTQLFGTAALCVGLGAWALVNLGEGGAPFALAAALVYLAGTIGVTMVFNVPRNNELTSVDPEGQEAAAAWERYLREWSAFNHLRTLSSSAATVLLAVALVA